MFPTTNIVENTSQEEKTAPIKRSMTFDYEAKRFVFKDGKSTECSDKAAIIQWIYLFLMTSLGRYKIYEDSNFGLSDYVGYKKSMLGYVKSEMEREISENIITNRAISGIRDFDAVPVEDELEISFIVVLKNGDEEEVTAYV